MFLKNVPKIQDRSPSRGFPVSFFSEIFRIFLQCFFSGFFNFQKNFSKYLALFEHPTVNQQIV